MTDIDMTEEAFERDMIATVAGCLDGWLESTPEGRASKAYMLSRYSDPSRFRQPHYWHGGTLCPGMLLAGGSSPETVVRHEV